MWAHGAPERQMQVLDIGKDTFGPFVDFVFGEAIETLHLAGFIPEVVARAERAFAVGHHEILPVMIGTLYPVSRGLILFLLVKGRDVAQGLDHLLKRRQEVIDI